MKSKTKRKKETGTPAIDGAPDMLTIRLPKPFRFRGALIRKLKFPRPCDVSFFEAIAWRRADVAAGKPPEKALGVHQLLTNSRAKRFLPRPLFNAVFKIEENAIAIDNAVFAAAQEDFFSAVARAKEASKAFADLALTAEFFAECMKQRRDDDAAREALRAAQKGASAQ